MKCAGCRSIISDEDEFLLCTNDDCGKFYHLLCTGGKKLTQELREVWVCPECSCASKKGGDNSTTPVGSKRIRDPNVTHRNMPNLQDSNVTFRKKTILTSTVDCKAGDSEQSSSQPHHRKELGTSTTTTYSLASTNTEQELAMEIRGLRFELAIVKTHLTHSVSLLTAYDTKLENYDAKLVDHTALLNLYEAKLSNYASEVKMLHAKLENYGNLATKKIQDRPLSSTSTQTSAESPLAVETQHLQLVLPAASELMATQTTPTVASRTMQPELPQVQKVPSEQPVLPVQLQQPPSTKPHLASSSALNVPKNKSHKLEMYPHYPFCRTGERKSAHGTTCSARIQTQAELSSASRDGLTQHDSILAADTWTEVRSKNRYQGSRCGTANSSVTSLKAVEVKKHIHLWNMESGSEEIREYLRHLCPSGVCTVDELTPKGNYKSFKLGIPVAYYETCLSTSVWPINARIKAWINLRPPNKPAFSQISTGEATTIARPSRDSHSLNLQPFRGRASGEATPNRQLSSPRQGNRK